MGLFIVMIGVQGAGKGTQAQLLSQKYGIPHISTGDLFRAMQTQDTPLAREVQAAVQASMTEGILVPDDITNRMVDERLKEADAQNGAIFDGYPRNVDQAAILDEMLQQKSQQIGAAILMELDRDIAFKRAEGRRYSQDKSRVYNVYFNPPKVEGIDDVDGQPLIQREDDYPEAVNKRIDIYYETTTPIIEYYRVRGLVTEINADQTIDAVKQDVFAAIERVKA
jgi:adenylate kinase